MPSHTNTKTVAQLQAANNLLNSNIDTVRSDSTQSTHIPGNLTQSKIPLNQDMRATPIHVGGADVVDTVPDQQVPDQVNRVARNIAKASKGGF